MLCYKEWSDSKKISTPAEEKKDIARLAKQLENYKKN